MKVEKIKKISNNKYRLFFDNDEKITTTDEVILINHLLYNKVVDHNLLNKIQIETAYYNLFNKVIKYINVRLRSEKEVILYLEKNAATDEEITKIIQKLKDIGLINDKIFARAYINDKLHFTNYGPCKIKQDLIDNNIDYNIIEELINDISLEDVYNKLSQMIQKKIKTNKNYSSYILKQKLLLDFVNFGYEKDMIIDLLNNNTNNDNVLLEKEYEKLYKKLSIKHSNNELYFKIKQKLYAKGFDYNQVNDFISKKTEII